jgi:molecular chaperone DnaK
MSNNSKTIRRLVGLDLGSSNSSISRWNGRGPEVIPVDGKALMPSVVTIAPADAVGPDESQIFVGIDGIEVGKRYRDYCFRLFKRRLGEMWHADEDTGYQTVGSGDGMLHYQGPDGHTYSPVELCSMVIGKLLDAATEKFKGERPDGAVICVPATFTPSQRKAVEEAGQMAGLAYIELMDEPTAAALAYGFDFKKVRRIAVLDVGGGTTDVSIIQTGNGLVTVLGTGGSSITGGSDVDAILGRYIVNEWSKQHETDLAVDDSAMSLVLQEAEQAKIRLSRKQKTEFRIKDFDRTPGGVVLHMDEIIDRPLLEHLAQDLLKRMRAACEVAMAEAKRKDPNFSARDLNDVVLVGGGTRMPAVQALARDIFGQDAKTDIDPEVAVVLGAAIRAAVIEGRKTDLAIQEALAFSIAVETFDKVEGVASVLFQRGHEYPTKAPITFALTNREPGQSALPIRVLAGDADRATGCELLHSLDIAVQPGEARSHRVALTVSLNAKGLPYGECGGVAFGSPD